MNELDKLKKLLEEKDEKIKELEEEIKDGVIEYYDTIENHKLDIEILEEKNTELEKEIESLKSYIEKLEYLAYQQEEI